ncbi:10583_t:CDS:10, partial [Diversispora eburnea]
KFCENKYYKNMAKSKYEYVKQFEKNDILLPNTCIEDDQLNDMIRFSDQHKFKKPNDRDALDLMNKCAVSVMNDIHDIVLAYGQSDEYRKIVSTIVSLFTSNYVFYWKNYFPQKELLYPPSFDGRAVLYPDDNNFRDYLSWRQVDCHINNLYNTCFWALVQSGKTESEAENALRSTVSSEKNELLFSQFNINYNKLPEMFRKGSVLIRKEVDIKTTCENGMEITRKKKVVLILHDDIIGDKFWKENLTLGDDNGNKVIMTSATNFKGRLGYACLNVYLRNKKPPIFCSRTCRISTIKEKGLDYVKELGRQNAKDLMALLTFNEKHNIKFMRISSGMFPFASHEIYGYSLDYAAEELKVAGEFAARNGHRLTTHPGQYNQLGSPRQEVIQRTITELIYHADMLNLMNLPLDSIMIIHMGGSYGDKVATLKRFEGNYKKLNKKIKNRLVLENDEISYSVEDLLPLCKKLKIPLVLDCLNPGTLSHDDLLALIPEINKTWTNKGLKPKQHYSEGRPGAKNVMEKRAHSIRVTKLPPCDPDMDLMIEAKDKGKKLEQAVFQLYQQYGLYPVDPEVIIPPTIKTNNIRGKKKEKEITAYFIKDQHKKNCKINYLETRNEKHETERKEEKTSYAYLTK